MKAQDQPLKGGQATPSTPQQPKSRPAWLTHVGAVIGVLLIAGLASLLFTWHRAADALPTNTTNGTHTGTTSGTWTLVQQGYNVQSLVAASHKPSILYACARKPSPSAPGVVTTLGPFVLLRSSDGGTHWQTITTQPQFINQCQLVVSPTNSNDLYLVGQSASTASSAHLFYSSDGGQHWTSITPRLSGNNLRGPTSWNIHDLSMVGDTLFGVQSVQAVLNPPPGQYWPSRTYIQSRLVRSSDGGQTWTVVDSYFDQNVLSVSSYAVDPQNPQIIYETVARPYWLIGPVQTPTGGKAIVGASLYKSTDGGTTWQQLLTDLPFSSKVQLASNNPSIVYAGGSLGPMPLAASAGVRGTSQNNPAINGNFRLQVSQNGGTSWQQINKPTEFISVQNWFVAPNGALYISSGYSQFGTPIVTQGTATLVGTVVIPQGKGSSTKSTRSVTGTNQTLPNSGSGAQVPTSGATPVPPSVAPMIEQYNPSGNQWSTIVQAPAYGTLIAVTSDSQGHSVLWLQVTHNNQAALYRYTEL